MKSQTKIFQKGSILIDGEVWNAKTDKVWRDWNIRPRCCNESLCKEDKVESIKKIERKCDTYLFFEEKT